jgi:Phytanoyl-CoA dioxygenase (PhyH)
MPNTSADAGPVDIDHLREFGWARIEGAVPVVLCGELVHILASELDVPINDPPRWDGYGREMGDLIPIWGHQAQWNIRQHPNLHRIWAALWGTEKLCVSLDSCRFTPPFRVGYAEPYGIHWDHDPWDDSKRMFQGVLALTDTAADQGGFCCAPSLYKNRAAWPRKPSVDASGVESWLATTTEPEILYPSARAGDLIVWDSRLAHGNSKNRSSNPRLAFYVMMGPSNDSFRRAAVESWRTGRCVAWWRSRPEYDRVEPWPPATLTALGRRLLGLDEWSDFLN